MNFGEFIVKIPALDMPQRAFRCVCAVVLLLASSSLNPNIPDCAKFILGL